MLYSFHRKNNKTYALDFRERAPLTANKTMFLSASSVKGGLSVAVPGEVAGYYQAWRRFGRLKWSDLFQPSIKLCNEGFKISKGLAAAMRKSEGNIRNSPDLRYAEEFIISIGSTDIFYFSFANSFVTFSYQRKSQILQ